MSTRVRVSNVSGHVSEEILHALFSFVGAVRGVKREDASDAYSVEFADATSVRAAEELSGTELGDRALCVIGEERLTVPVSSMHAQPLANPSVVASMDGLRSNEISRTIYVGNISSHVTDRDLMQFFAECGRVAYVKMAGDGIQPTRFAFVEFADTESAQRGLLMNGHVVADRPLKVNHSKNSINKPVPVSVGRAQTMASVLPLAGGVHVGGVAWPVLGTTVQSKDLDRKIAEIQRELESKYGR
ncbi:hypothetical protein GGH12_004033 [Coemansia sp. RSA 1822]|nr:hypothetical protein LPJ76_000922 [Coemansia sp. RSA 638]KAJ2123892.1 hypothetical protein IW147_002154 [Coemansia sp. RSA 720]KAJ2544039.1 hypothetical protein GGF49_001548 [Coemansia sp. RSA 1853]KAJ2561407.1 hypothetical protein GGH12_004033 [Coemansia sp. RSA 1822]